MDGDAISRDFTKLIPRWLMHRVPVCESMNQHKLENVDTKGTKPIQSEALMDTECTLSTQWKPFELLDDSLSL